MVDSGNARMPAVTKAVVPAAGLGTRFLPATKATPKEMLPVVDKPAIEYVVTEAVAAGPTDAPVVPGRRQARDRIRRHRSRRGRAHRRPDDHRPQQARAGGPFRPGL